MLGLAIGLYLGVGLGWTFVALDDLWEDDAELRDRHPGSYWGGAALTVVAWPWFSYKSEVAGGETDSRKQNCDRGGAS
jgi:hypothetical protein